VPERDASERDARRAAAAELHRLVVPVLHLAMVLESAGDRTGALAVSLVNVPDRVA
jgi:hypothetical protein